MGLLTTVSEERASLQHHASHGESMFSEECLYFSEEVQQMKQSFTFHHSCITVGARKKGLTSLRATSSTPLHIDLHIDTQPCCYSQASLK